MYILTAECDAKGCPENVSWSFNPFSIKYAQAPINAFHNMSNHIKKRGWSESGTGHKCPKCAQAVAKEAAE